MSGDGASPVLFLGAKDVSCGHPGRSDAQQVALFKSPGMVLDDVSTARVPSGRARAATLGHGLTVSP